MRRRAGLTLALCLLLLGTGLVPPAAAAPAARPPRTGMLIPERGRALTPPVQGAAATAQESAEAEAPFPFSMLGVELPAGASAEVRTSTDGQTWSPWMHADVHVGEGPEPGPHDTAAAFSVPLWVGEARYVQTRVRGADSGAVKVHLVDSAGLSRNLAERVTDAFRAGWGGAPAAMAAPGQPEIRSRAQWGADEAKTRPADVAPRIRHGFVHHTVNANSYGAGDVPAILRGIQAYHIDVRGWNDIGYNLLVDRFGIAWEGRAGGIETPVVGAQAQGFNTGSFGVAVIGDYSAVAPPPAVVDGLTHLLAWKYDVHHVDAQGAVEVTSGGSNRYPAGARVHLPALGGHRDVALTSCPGRLYDVIGLLRQRIVEAQGDVLLDPSASAGSLRVAGGSSLDGPVALTTRLRPAGDWRLEVRDPGGSVVHSQSGSGAVANAAWVPSGASRGRYTWTFSGGTRRPASGTVDLVAPAVQEVALDPPQGRVGDDGGLASPVTLRARLWAGAQWRVTVADPGGREVFAQAGTGERVEATWPGEEARAGGHTWTIAADDVPPVTGSLLVVRDVLARLAGAPDAVDRAIALSLAAFPESGSAGHAVVARADVFADAMAGGPLAGEDGPVLLNGSGGLDGRVEAELDRLLGDGATVYLLGGEAALSRQVADALGARWRVVRLAGEERTATAARVADQVIGRSGATTVLVARADSPGPSPWADAMTGGAYGADRGFPVLLTDTATLSPPAEAAIRRLGITDAIVLGGTAAISDQVAGALPRARRIAGAERAATAAAVARELWGRGQGVDGDRLILVGGYREDAWTLALPAAPLAARSDAPLYVADAGTLPPATADALSSLGYDDSRRAAGWVLGGEEQVAAAVVEEANGLID